ncbi:MAG: Methyltransferase protein [Candidatus Hydrogenedentes bacterium]|nr:Methyltransferase protein [Candidatus Hydrogenedentota bacterium]
MSDLRAMTAALNELSTGFVRSQILFVANDANVFALLEEERSADEMAARVGWDPRGARMLLDGLVALELVEKREGLYRNAPLASACLVPGKIGYQGNIVRHQRNGMAAWMQLDESVRTGQAAASERKERTPAELLDFILGMKDIGQLSAQEMLGVVDCSRYRHMLDLGGGPASYAIAFLHAYPGMRATVFDRPEVLDIAREEVAAAGLDGRFGYIGGDMEYDALGSGYDLILMSNIVHSMGSETNRAIVQKCFGALEPGGRFIIKDFIVENDRSGPPFSLIFALRMLLNSGAGDTYTYDEVASWTHDAGFPGGQSLPLARQSRLWIVDKP